MPTDELTVVAGSHLRGSSGFRGIQGESRLRPRIVPKECTTRYFMRCRDDGYVTEVIVYNPDFTKLVLLTHPDGRVEDCGPAVVFTRGPNGEHQRWGCRHERDDELTFTAHPGYVHTTLCVDCRGARVVGVDPVTNPMGSLCRACEGSGQLPRRVTVVTHKTVVAERIYLEPPRLFSFAEPPVPSGVQK